MIPRPEATTAATSSALSPEPASAGPTPPSARAPWQLAQARAKTACPAAGSPPAVSAAAGASAAKGCHWASP